MFISEFRKTPCFELYNILLQFRLAIWHSKPVCVFFFFTAGNCKGRWQEVRKRIVAELNYSANFQTVLWCHFICESACKKRPAFVFSLKRDKNLTIYLPFINHSNLHKLKTFDSPLTISHKPFHLSLKMLTLHKVDTNKCAGIRSLYQLLNLEVMTVEEWDGSAL